MNVLSLFDGMSCGQIALERAGLKVNKYYASEIDKYAIKVTQSNYPNTVQLGDIINWRKWDIDWSSIDLVTGGFPCQAWSVAGKELGDKDKRGMLFWTMLDIIKTILTHNPKAKFLIENVKMKKEFEEYITHHTEQALGKVDKYLINSSLVSAQNRQRYYWTNIEGIEQPKDKNITLNDIVIDGANSFIARMVGRRVNKEGKREDYNINIPRVQRLEIKPELKSNNLSTVGKDNLLVFLGGLPKGLRLKDGKYYSRNYREGYKIYSIGGKSAILTASSKGGPGGYSGLYDIKKSDIIYYRNLLPIECERLQTVPDNYTNYVSDTQRYKMLGNGWTVDVIMHILKNLKNNQK